jgi:hypothetical protein
LLLLLVVVVVAAARVEKRREQLWLAVVYESDVPLYLTLLRNIWPIVVHFLLFVVCCRCRCCRDAVKYRGSSTIPLLVWSRHGNIECTFERDWAERSAFGLDAAAVAVAVTMTVFVAFV